jgi:hypothetical protein
MAANSETGQIWVSSVWETAEDRAASEAKVADLRKSTAATAGAPGAKVELFESVHVEFKVGAAAPTS